MSVIILKTDEKKNVARKIMSRLEAEKGLEAKKYCGKIELSDDPLQYQKKMVLLQNLDRKSVV